MHCRKIVKKRIILIVILSLFIVGFLTPFFRLATEGTPIPDDVARLRTSLSADFYAISESDYTTRWRLQNASITSVEDFRDDLTSQKWRLNDTSDSSFSVYTSLLIVHNGTNWYAVGQSED